MAKNTYHYAVKAALEKEGWTITHDILANQPFFQLIVTDNQIHLIVYEPDTQTINAWYI